MLCLSRLGPRTENYISVEKTLLYPLTHHKRVVPTAPHPFFSLETILSHFSCPAAQGIFCRFSLHLDSQKPFNNPPTTHLLRLEAKNNNPPKLRQGQLKQLARQLMEERVFRQVETESVRLTV